MQGAPDVLPLRLIQKSYRLKKKKNPISLLSENVEEGNIQGDFASTAPPPYESISI